MIRVPVDIEEPPFKTVTYNLSSYSSTPRTSSTPTVTFSFGLPMDTTRAPIEIKTLT